MRQVEKDYRVLQTGYVLLGRGVLETPRLGSCVYRTSIAQGQTLKGVGVYWPKSYFSHGQLYVAFSRVGDDKGLHALALEHDLHRPPGLTGTYTRNVVLEVLS